MLFRSLVLGWLRDSRTVDTVAPLLIHPQVGVRLDAAAALALTRSPEAAEVLRSRIPQETDKRVRQKLQRQLNVLTEALHLPPPPPPPKPRVLPPPPLENRNREPPIR